MVGDIERVLGALNSAGVRYLIVGGVAVVLHGHLRTTADLDLVVQLERDNVLRAMPDLIALKSQARRPLDLDDIEALEELDAADVGASEE